ncbi:hypothetical protein [Gloeobacter violaceus]|uniref:Gll1670 protein n=1 Tax=Gloeobacter violaceus (strain ATCC 29082 / PCC 7421) TaxID=251221 RepID=Q7NK10_GLOVI|nr:hypothetical protein [Gloeobacter violaceus]BAC89611.1 gll1670 [Gloeobacter violaceus PCC 7421]
MALQDSSETTMPIQGENLLNEYGKDISLLSDEELEILVSIRVAPEQDERLHCLLEMHRDGALEPSEQAELERLMTLFEGNVLKQSQAGAELARRKRLRAAHV